VTVIAFPELTEREADVLGLLAAGPGQLWGHDAIGGSAPRRLHNHASNIITKLHVSDGREPISGHESRLGRSRVG
jgi:hypothetical protein